MSDRARKCLVIAAGRGSRLASDGLPKPLFRLLGLPLIERAIVTAKRAGLEDFTVVTGYDGTRIRRFLDRLAIRREVTLTHVVNEDWQAGNGVSVLKARAAVGEEPFALLMADHLVSPRLLRELLAEPLEEGYVRLGIDRNLRNPLVDVADVTRVRAAGRRLEAIGKQLEDYDAFDTGCFVCSPVLFENLERARERDGDETLSGGIRALAASGKVEAHDIGDAFWIDVDDRGAVRRAERALIARLPKLGDGPVSRYLNRPLSTRITRRLVVRSVTPNQISVFCFGLSLLAAALFAAGGTLVLALGGLLAQLASVVDGCDGEVARLQFRESVFGGWFDAVLDRYSDAFLLFGLTWHVFAEQGGALVLGVGFLAITGSFMVSYTADKHDGLMKARFERGEVAGFRIGRDLRVLVIALGAVANLPFVALSLIAGIMNAETVRRVVSARTFRAPA
ncbi:MAG: NTP transferase domain-containing protein [Myxococcota bacterium]